MDFKPLVLRGKNPINTKRDISIDNVHAKSDVNHANKMNASSLERKIDSGEVTTPQKIPANVSALFRTARMNMKNAEGNTLTQDAFARSVNVRSVDAKFINMIENGSLLLNHANKITLRNLQQKLKLAQFELP